MPGAKLIDQLVGQGLTFNPEVVLNEKVESIEKQEDGLFRLEGSSGQIHLSKTVIVAVGAGQVQLSDAATQAITNSRCADLVHR